MGVLQFGGDPKTANSLEGLRAFSAEIESWHNGAHAAIQVATGVPMMNAAENIFYQAFWRLHLFIDNKFQAALQQYEASTHPDAFLNVSSIAAHIEVTHHTWVPEI